MVSGCTNLSKFCNQHTFKWLMNHIWHTFTPWQFTGSLEGFKKKTPALTHVWPHRKQTLLLEMCFPSWLVVPNFSAYNPQKSGSREWWNPCVTDMNNKRPLIFNGLFNFQLKCTSESKCSIKFSQLQAVELSVTSLCWTVTKLNWPKPRLEASAVSEQSQRMEKAFTGVTRAGSREPVHVS